MKGQDERIQTDAAEPLKDSRRPTEARGQDKAGHIKILIGIGCVVLYLVLVNLPTPAGLTLAGRNCLAKSNG